ncbi:MAG: DUF4143 domain-containing protein, partial [Propionibacteriaceae bacterium]|nr:DUF4143 domain-containing protein [Propionibacteriaceae bacterium]
ARLDQANVAESFRDDPDATLRAFGEPVVLDEWQHVPEVLGAVKRAVDAGSGPGRFILTGSVSAGVSPGQWPGTGRIVELHMTTLTQRELAGGLLTPDPAGRTLLVDRLPAADLPDRRSTRDITDYLGLALRSGFPEAVDLPDRVRSDWLASYLDQVVHRDSQLADAHVDPTRFGRYLRVLGTLTACVASDQTLFAAAGVSRPTAAVYEHLLHRLHLLTTIPAWASNALKRIVSTGKRVLADPALAASLMREDAAGILLQPALKGRIVETLVAAQLSAEAPLSRTRPILHHLRDRNGDREIDFLLEYSGQRVVGVEVKAAATATKTDAKHLMWLRDRLGDRFQAGVVLYAGELARELDDRIYALPLDSWWLG